MWTTSIFIELSLTFLSTILTVDTILISLLSGIVSITSSSFTMSLLTDISTLSIVRLRCQSLSITCRF